MEKYNNKTNGENTKAESSTVEKSTASETSLVDKSTKADTAGMVKIKARTTTGKQHYYRAGLRFGTEYENYEVSKELLKKIKADKWLDAVEV